MIIMIVLSIHYQNVKSTFNSQLISRFHYEFTMNLIFLRQVSGMKYSNKMSTYHLACENRGFK